jgi:hypothetical protein
MEKLCGIWDGSEGEKAKGYHLCQVTSGFYKKWQVWNG